MLTEKKVYTEIVKETGASTATISRVKRALFDNDTYGYTLVLDRIPKEDK
jgi:TrpR-related protein YerC/YecD